MRSAAFIANTIPHKKGIIVNLQNGMGIVVSYPQKNIQSVLVYASGFLGDIICTVASDVA